MRKPLSNGGEAVNIPEGVIDIAAQVHYGHPWTDRTPEWSKHESRRIVTEILEAVAPRIAAQGIRDAADELDKYDDEVVADIIRGYADRLEFPDA